MTQYDSLFTKARHQVRSHVNSCEMVVFDRTSATLPVAVEGYGDHLSVDGLGGDGKPWSLKIVKQIEAMVMVNNHHYSPMIIIIH